MYLENPSQLDIRLYCGRGQLYLENDIIISLIDRILHGQYLSVFKEFQLLCSTNNGYNTAFNCSTVAILTSAVLLLRCGDNIRNVGVSASY